MRTLGGLLLALGIASCYGHDRPIGETPTPLSVKSSAAQPQAPDRVERTDAAELAKNGATCSADSDCTGRLRCVSYNVSGRELRKCLFPCGDGCPSGWNCQIVSDGPTNTCARAR